ncbi:1-acyl-sn-glycerol-3-phosphate acyltransferase [Lottiidibacillus patelloidae]|uniref:1-acyl-sn-glycerol-3-phosphate acyltransferase n=1 Tax=Lottiidibacillus patelloidae TaxID=2670334 RepID=A0A263BVQ9_9BACI|nr:lysophospholipid acyltransferase family protein [Lottiidibacillus patelloidae]OZM57256.1 1-acyl-sn-glycerol-3-phosphate acyltransferase [Lottiidibacillus patelloidae]
MSLYAVGRSLFYTYFKLFNRVEAIGIENVPKEGGIVACSNHISALDPPLLGTMFPRKVHFMAKAELFTIPILKSIIKAMGAFPVRRGMGDKQALRTGLQMVGEQKVIGIFPEGTRSKDGKLQKGLAGSAFFALKSEAKVVPCAIVGSYAPFKKLKIYFGEPVDLEDLKDQKGATQLATDRIMLHIQQLIDQDA